MRRPFLSALLVAGVLVLGACGNDDAELSGSTTSVGGDAPDGPVEDDDSVRAVLRQAPGALIDAGSAHMEIEVDMSDFDLPGVGDAGITMEGDVDARTGDSVLRMDMSAMFGAMLPAGASIDPIEVRMVDGVMYMDFGTMMRQIADAAGEELPPSLDFGWVQIDLEELGGGGAGSDPSAWAQNLALLPGADDVEEVGTEEVDGVSTTHYEARVDAESLEAMAEEQTEGLLDEMPDYLADAMRDGFEAYSGDIEIDVWIDADGVARRMVMVAPLDLPNVGEGEVRTTMTVSDLGVEVDVEAPEDAVDFAEVMEQIAAA